MKIDMSQFENLELDNIGQWPPAAKALACVFVAVVMLVVGYMMFVSDRITRLDNITKQEKELRTQYQAKYHISSNLELFQQQMIDAEKLFSNQLKSLPESHETPGLLDDITFVGTTSGLDFVTLNWQPEIKKEIYIELPIDIEVIGTYHEFGQFVSKIASLPRIVTLHDFEIKMMTGSDNLRLNMQAKTYRYKETSNVQTN